MKLCQIFETTGDNIISGIPDGDIDNDANPVHRDLIDDIITPPFDISPDVMVGLIKDGSVIKTDSWENMVAFLHTMFDQLNGTYKIVNKDGVELHSFVVSN